MTNYPNLNNEPAMLKMQTRDDEIKNIEYQSEKHDHQDILKSCDIDNEKCKKKYRSLKEKKI